MMGRRHAAVRDAQSIITTSDPATAFPQADHAIVAVQTAWNGWRTAMVHVADLEGIHWLQPPGAPRPLLHAIVSCDRVISGEVEHPCHDTPAPHRLLVCLLKCHLSSTVFDQLASRASNQIANR
jgi:hypothetical protein